MLCCSLVALLLSQLGALFAVAKVRLFGSSGAVAVAGHVKAWSKARWMMLGGGLAAELVVAAAVMPALYAIDVPARVLGDWPSCMALLSAVSQVRR